MTIANHEIKALHLDMARVLSDAEYVIHHIGGQRNVKHLVEQDIRHLRDQLNRLDKHLEQLDALQSTHESVDYRSKVKSEILEAAESQRYEAGQ